MKRNMTKEESLKKLVQKFWEKRVPNILVTGTRGDSPSEGEFLSAYNDVKFRHPECNCVILREKKSTSEYFLPGDKIGGIRIVEAFGTANSSIEIILTSSTYYLHFNFEGMNPILQKADFCDLSQTIKKFENFINKFPLYLEELETKRIQLEKNAKLEEMTKNSIKAGVSQVLSIKGYRWNIVDKVSQQLLQIEIGNGSSVEIVLNSKNFAKRISALSEELRQIEEFLKTLPFSVNILMTKDVTNMH